MKKTIKTLVLVALTLQVANSANATSILDGIGRDQNKKTYRTSAESGPKCFDEKTHIINLGVGFGMNYYSGYSGSGYAYRSSPAFSLSYEQAIPKKLGPGYLGAGAYFGFQTSNSTYNYFYDKHGYYNNYYYKNNWNNFMIAARAAYHWDVLNFKKADIYAGALIGVRIQTYDYTTNNPDPYADNYRLSQGSAYPSFSVFAGARWYFASKIAVFGEFGYGISYVTGGLSFKF
jgi:hypothetical protein